MLNIITIGIFSILSFFGSKTVAKIFPINSKFFAAITALLFLFISLLVFSFLSGWSIPQLLSSRGNMVLFVIILTGGYYGFLSNFDSEIDESIKNS